MRIAIDASPLFKLKTGVGYYTFHLITNLLCQAPKAQYSLFADRKPPVQRIKELFPNGGSEYQCYFSRLPLKGYHYLWRYLKLPVFDIVTGIDADVYHGVNFFPIPTNRGKSVITIHDIYFLMHPENLNFRTRITLGREIEYIVRNVDFIITVSDSTRKDVLQRFNLKPEKIKAIPLAASQQFTHLGNENINQATRNRYAGGQQYILYLGTLEPRKNLVRLIKAFALIKQKGFPHKLIMAGKKGWLYEEVFKTIETLNLKEDVITPDYVPDEDLVPLYNAADAFVFPSLYEGFGLPVLEAMACGTPVITTNISSLPEVVGEAGILIHPQDTEGLAEAIERVLNDADLRKTLRTKGLQQVKKFSWQKTAKETLDVYRSLV